MTHSAGWTGRSPAITRVNNARAERWEDTDWEQVVLLYDMPLHLAPSPVTRLHGAIAVAMPRGTRAVTRKRPVPRRRSYRPDPRAPREWSGRRQRILRGDDLVAHEVIQGLDEVRPVARSRSRHASSPGARHSKWSGKARISASAAALPVRLAGRPGVSKAVSRRRSSRARTDARESSPAIAHVASMSTSSPSSRSGTSDSGYSSQVVSSA